MSSSSISDFGQNTWLVEEMYQQFKEDPSSVDPSWHELLKSYKPGDNGGPVSTEPASTPSANGSASGSGRGSAPATPAGETAPRKQVTLDQTPTRTAAARKPSPAKESTATKAASGHSLASRDGSARSQPKPAATAGAAKSAPSDAKDNADANKVLRGPAAAIAKNMALSLEIPTATSVRAVPAKAMIDNRIVVNNHLARTRGGKISFTHILGYAIVQAIKAFPNMNRHYAEIDGKPNVVTPAHTNLGLAIDLVGKDGNRTLVVAAIKECETMGFAEFYTAYQDIVRRARDGKLGADDFSGVTISLTNPGTIGTVHSVPRLMKGQGAIIGAGAMEYPAEFQGASDEQIAELGVGKLMTLTSTYDHRIIQGAESGDFLRTIHQLLIDDAFYDEIFTAFHVPYEPVRWRRDIPAGLVDKSTRVLELIAAYRSRGHLMADIDPLMMDSDARSSHPDLDIATYGLTLWDLSRKGAAPLRLDAVLLDAYRIPHGVIEAKDDQDDLAAEMRAKLKLGYPAKNTIFWQPRRAILVQDGKVVLDCRLDTCPQQLCEILQAFFAYTEPVIADWERATDEFRERVAELGRSLREVIQRARGVVGSVPNKKFVTAFDDFAALCRAAINPGLADSAIEEMLIQHLLTARLFGSIFNNPEFTRRNVVAIEIEKVIDALASGHFSRQDFLKKLDRFYLAIENAATTIEDFSEKQKFLNTVYEKFFQGFAVKVADTMGIVYTPPSIVRFMISSIRELLKKEFGKDLGDPGVHVLDPFTGTGNFLVHLIRELPAKALKQKFAGELWANEIMLLPYYIAAQNIEHEYFEKTGTYEPFPGLCLVDTFELAEPRDTEFEFMVAANTERVNAQKKAPIRVILGNPPYNANQQDENDNNKNRKYPHLDRRIRNTYAADSNATLLNKLSDPYIKAIRWASDRIGDEGIVAYVTNSGYLDGIATDGVRHHLAQDFDAIYVVDLGGNVRKNPKLSGTTHNVFGIQVGVSIALFVRHKQKELKARKCVLRYAEVGEDWTKEHKWQWLEDKASIGGVKWRTLKPDARNTWLHDEESAGFAKFISIASKETKSLDSLDAQAIFRTYSLGVSTNRDAVVYDFNRDRLAKRVSDFADDYNSEVSRYQRKKPPADELDAFLKTERIKWSRNLKSELKREKFLEFDKGKMRLVSYRPFTRRYLYLDDVAVDEPAQSRVFAPAAIEHAPAITLSDVGHRAEFATLMVNGVYDLHFAASSDAFQSFPLYTYDTDGGHRRDNVTDWALEQFKAQYPKAKITKKDIFHYVYAVLHHPAYRDKYAANLRRELPRIPFAPDFAAFAKTGEKLAALHTGYESQKEFKLKRVETEGVKPDWRVEKMKLSKNKSELVYNGWLTLAGIPAAAHEYRLGNRSALDWVIDQYQVERSKENPDEILSDPNRADDEEYVVRLVGQIVTVSVETMKLVGALPPLGAPPTGYTQADLDAAHIYVAEDGEPQAPSA